MIITNHAIRRLVQRLRPDLNFTEARRELEHASRNCIRAGRTVYGQAVWNVPITGEAVMRLVTKHDPEFGAVVVTVLEPEEHFIEEESAPLLPPTKEELAKQELERTAKARLVKAATDTNHANWKQVVEQRKRELDTLKWWLEQHQGESDLLQLDYHTKIQQSQEEAAEARRLERKERHDAMLAEHAAKKAEKLAKKNGVV